MRLLNVELIVIIPSPSWHCYATTSDLNKESTRGVRRGVHFERATHCPLLSLVVTTSGDGLRAETGTNAPPLDGIRAAPMGISTPLLRR